MKSQICKWTTNINMNYMNCICQIMSNLILSLSPRWPRWPSCGQLFWSSWAKRSRELRWELRWGQSIWAPEQQLHGICKRHMVTRQTHGHTSWLRDVQSFNLAAVVRVRSTSSAACSAACFCISEQIMDQWMYESCMNHDSDLTTAKIFICNSEVSLCPRSVRPGSQGSWPWIWLSAFQHQKEWLVACGLDDDLAGCAICGVHTCRSHYSLDTTAERQDHWCTEEFSEGAFCAGPVQSEVRHYGIPVRLPRPLESCVVLCRDCQIVFHSSLSFRSCGWNRLIWPVIDDFLTAADRLSVCSWGLNRLLCDLFRLEVPDTVG